MPAQTANPPTNTKPMTPGIIKAIANCKGVTVNELIVRSESMPKVDGNGNETWAGRITVFAKATQKETVN